MPDAAITIVVPAAGESRRFGSRDKLGTPLAGVPLILHVARAATDSGAAATVVVGRRGIARALEGTAVRVVSPPRDSSTMGGSIAAGVRASRDADGWLVWPGDMPLVRPATVRVILSAFDPAAPVVPVLGDARGHPVLFPARYRDALLALDGRSGARGVLASADRVVELPVDDPGIRFDVDSEEDLARAEALLAR